MADTKISALAAVASIDGTEEIGVNESGTSKKATGAQIAAYQETRLQQGVLCTHASDQTLTTATWTPLDWDTETWKVGDAAIHSTSVNPERLTAQIDGEYMVTGIIAADPVAADFILSCRVRINATGEAAKVAVPNVNDAAIGTNLSVPSIIVQLSASDYVTVEVRHEKGSDGDILSTGSTFGMYLLGR